MVHSIVEIDVKAHIKDVWKYLGDFSLEFLKDVVEIKVNGKDVGAIRYIKTPSGIEFSERLEVFQPENYILSYKVLPDTPECKNHLSTIKLTKVNNYKTHIYWDSVYETKPELEKEREKFSHDSHQRIVLMVKNLLEN